MVKKEYGQDCGIPFTIKRELRRQEIFVWIRRNLEKKLNRPKDQEIKGLSLDLFEFPSIYLDGNRLGLCPSPGQPGRALSI